ncbi:MAG TPA: hypothetical protein VHM69_18445 [Rubrobacter sp.]|nr:hypothetical protein [Rubrobacter sp.]
MGEAIGAVMAAADSMVFGRVTYEAILDALWQFSKRMSYSFGEGIRLQVFLLMPETFTHLRFTLSANRSSSHSAVHKY